MSSSNEGIYSADPSFDFNRQVFKGICRWARASDPSDSEDIAPIDSPLTSLTCTDDSRPATPELPPRIPQTSASKPPTGPAPSLPSEPPPLPPIAAPTRMEKRKAKKKEQGRKREKMKKARTESFEPKAGLALKQLHSAVSVSSNYNAESFDIVSTGYISQRERGHTTTYSLDQLTGPGSRYKLELKKWDGKSLMPLLDRNNLVIGICAGQPRGDETWDSVQLEASDLLEEARPRLRFKKKDLKHRRGGFPALAVGISHGGGQSYPRMLVQEAQNMPVLDNLLKEEAFRRISGFTAGAFARWAPRLYAHQNECLSKIIAHDQKLRETKKHPNPDEKELRRNFAHTPWAATTLNFGPRTVCYKHADFGNLAFGWCSITALGYYDYKKGGHLVLWDLGLVIEFPPGSTILIPSSAIHHSNVRIQPTERRYSFTQYSSGGIFRWIDNGYKKSVDSLGGMDPEEKAKTLDDLSNQLEYGLSLYSTLEELDSFLNQSTKKTAVV